MFIIYVPQYNDLPLMSRFVHVTISSLNQIGCTLMGKLYNTKYKTNASCYHQFNYDQVLVETHNEGCNIFVGALLWDKVFSLFNNCLFCVICRQRGLKLFVTPAKRE